MPFDGLPLGLPCDMLDRQGLIGALRESRYEATFAHHCLYATDRKSTDSSRYSRMREANGMCM